MTERARSEEERAYYALNERVFASFAPFYDAVTFPIRGLRRQVVTMVDVGPEARVLDVATGTGAQAAAFATRAREVVGVDLSDAMLRVARRMNRFPNVTFLHGDATRLPFDDATFDVTCVSFGLHEMPDGVRRQAVHEIARVTKASGLVAVVDYGLPRNRVARLLAYHTVKVYERGHYATFVKQDLEALLESAGIEPSASRRPLFGLVQVVVGHPSRGGRLRAMPYA